jgi:hypothetical protein
MLACCASKAGDEIKRLATHRPSRATLLPKRLAGQIKCLMILLMNENDCAVINIGRRLRQKETDS